MLQDCDRCDAGEEKRREELGGRQGEPHAEAGEVNNKEFGCCRSIPRPQTRL